MNSSPYAGWRALLKLGAFVLLCSLPWTAQAQTNADRDGDGLIEIDSLLMLHNMRHNLAGTSYKTSASSSGDTSGCPSNTCIGYELTDNLDFDVDGDGDGTWSGNAEDGFTLDPGDTEAHYFPVDTGGWLPIGSGANPFVAVFDGNNHTISNLAIRRSQTNIGLFGVTGGAAVIRNLGLVDNLADYTGSSNNNTYIGGLVGQSEGSITASYATGDSDGGDGKKDRVGGLVGQSEGSITASYATGDSDGGDGNEDLVGGLVGRQGEGSITASYASGDADGGDGNNVDVGGLVGRQGGGSITASYATGGANSGGGTNGRVGGLVGYKYEGSITASYATGNTDGGGGTNDRVGGLVGQQREGSITASYATGDADGGSGNYDRAGGLVGVLEDGSITASYATGDAHGGGGADDRVGELVGLKNGGSITASYAFGGTTGGEIDDSGSDGSAKPAGVGAAADLTADNAGTTWNSAADNTLDAWDFGTNVQIPALNYADYDDSGTVFDCSQFPAGVCGTLILGQRQLSVSLTLEGDATVDEGTIVTLSAELSFVIAEATVVLLEVVAGGPNAADDADIVIEGDVFSVTIAAGATSGTTEFTVLDDDIDEEDEILMIGIAAGGDLTSDQIIEVMITDNDTRGVEISATSLNLTEGESGIYTVVLTSQPNSGNVTVTPTSGDTSRVSIGDITAGSMAMASNLVFSAEDWHITRTVQITTSSDADETDNAVDITHQVVADTGGDYASVNAADVVVTVEEGDGGNGGGTPADRDGNGLIEIDSLLMLHNMRHNLAGTSYKTKASSSGDTSGCPSNTCIGYELTQNLDFDGDGDGTWWRNDEGSYTLDVHDRNDDYFPVTMNADGTYDDGWLPIGDDIGPFVAVFDGNTHTISNLAIRREQTYIGLFGKMGPGAAIRNLRLVDNLADNTGSSDLNNYIGGLAGWSEGSITASYATGDADGGGGNNDAVGGLVGESRGSITASYATGDADGGDGDNDRVGGLVGESRGSITASYAMGDADGGDGDQDYVGGLVGQQREGSITASYATGDADGGDGDNDRVGGLVGQFLASITASYATGDVHGGDGDDDAVGGLVGFQSADSSITASYAMGDADGGSGDDDRAGGLVGWQIRGGSITASYGFGGALGDRPGKDGSPPVSTAAQLTLANAGTTWNSAADNTLGAWNFSTGGQIPTLNYADYDDDSGTVFDCGQFPAGVCDTLTPLPGQLSVSLTLGGAATVDEGTIVTLSAELSFVIAEATVVLLEVVAGGQNAADDADIVIEGDVFSVTIAAGAISGTTEFTVLDDDIDEGDEILMIGIAAGGDLTSDQIIEVMITDNDTRGVEISATSLNLTEGESGNYTVVLTSQPDSGNVTVTPTSGDSTRVSIGDITAESMPSNLVFSAEDWHITRTVQITTSSDADETDNAVDITHQVVADTGGDYVGVNAADVVVTVEEGDGGNGGGTPADRDGNGLIEIDSLLMLHNMRHNLAGTSYKTKASSSGDTSGCPSNTCIGYELTRNLDFDGDGDGTWSGNAEEGFTLDPGDTEANYFPVDAGGWLPIGDGTTEGAFVAEFNGNDHTISNLAIRRTQTHIGLFGKTGPGAVIRNLGLVGNLADYTGSSNSDTYIGGLVGLSQGSITASYATGDADGGDGASDQVGGLVGQSEGLITESHATGDADGGAGDEDSVGGLVGEQSGGSITASYAMGDADGGSGVFEYVGGLVGEQNGGSITASYAMGAADGGVDDQDFVGGLVGLQDDGGSITASYAMGAADGGGGNNDSAGGLVGWQIHGSITASYATGDADGGDGDQDYVGGLAGRQDVDGSITASYATGDTDGGDGDSDYVGELVGQQNGGSIMASYGFGKRMGEHSIGSDGSLKPGGVTTADQLTAEAANAEDAWNKAESNTLGAWNFSTGGQIPTLNYADYDGSGPTGGTVFDCNQFPTNACNTLLPGQVEAVAEVSASGPSTAGRGENVSLVASLLFGTVTINAWEWRQLEGLEVILSDAAARETTFTAPTASTLLVFELTATDSEGSMYTDRISIAVVVDVDGDGLIEIYSLTDLHNMRHNLAGTSYMTATTLIGEGDDSGCPATSCFGYELANDLDFDYDNDGSTWSDNGDLGYSLDSGDNKADYFPVDGDGAGGWLPIGDETNTFAAVFDGNTHTISNLAIRRDQTYIGLFGRMGPGAAIRNLGLVDNLADYTGSSTSDIFIGGLVGESSGLITASYATGAVAGGVGDDSVGGLVGRQAEGSIAESYATTCAVAGRVGDDSVGGLVGHQTEGSITESYATCAAAGGVGDDSVGGLVGHQAEGSIELRHGGCRWRGRR